MRGYGLGIGAIVIIVVVTLIVFLICRELVCWYWKINEIRDLLRNISNKEFSPNYNKELSDIARCLSNINDKLSEIQFQNIEQKSKITSSEKNTGNKTNASGKKEAEDESYSIINKSGRIFAWKGGKLYCPKCHAFVDTESQTSCSDCGISFMS